MVIQMVWLTSPTLLGALSYLNREIMKALYIIQYIECGIQDGSSPSFSQSLNWETIFDILIQAKL